MQNRIKLLYELRPAQSGFSGIPQETRLLFKLFCETESDIKLSGLINHGSAILTKGYKEGRKYNPKTLYKRFDTLSKHIVSHYECYDSIQSKLFAIDDHLINYFKLQAKNILGISEPLYSFNTERFEDFIWNAYFSKSLSVEDYPLVTSQDYKILEKPWDLLHRVGIDLSFLSRYPKINTKYFDMLLAQTPFPGQVSKNTKLIIRYHDAIPIFYPHTINNPKVHRAAHFYALINNVKNNAHFVCTSNTVKGDLLSVFPQAEKRTTVINDMISPNFYPENDIDKTTITEIIRRRITSESNEQFITTSEEELFYKEHLDNDNYEYILMVSTIEPRKNHECLINAWQNILQNHNKDIKLILVGELGWNYDSTTDLMETCRGRGQLFHLTQVPTSELRKLYSQAKATVCPSFAEGFDLSGIEAMLCHCPVIASDIPVHQEVYSDAAIYFNPHSSPDCTNKLNEYFNYNINERQTIIEKGNKIVEKYNDEIIKNKWLDYLSDLTRQDK